MINCPTYYSTPTPNSPTSFLFLFPLGSYSLFPSSIPTSLAHSIYL